MKKITSLLFFALLIGTLSECKKGEDDPFLSLRRRKARVVGDWKLTSGTNNVTSSSNSGTSSSSDSDTYTYTETSYALISSSTNNGVTSAYSDAGVYTYQIDFKKDGTYSSTENIDGYVTIETGVWNFTHGVGEYKNKEQIALTQRTRLAGSSSSTYTGKEPDRTITLKELRNKKMVIVWDNTGSYSTTGSGFTSTGTSSEKGESTLEQ
jgi:hypothetical protein